MYDVWMCVFDVCVCCVFVVCVLFVWMLMMCLMLSVDLRLGECEIVELFVEERVVCARFRERSFRRVVNGGLRLEYWGVEMRILKMLKILLELILLLGGVGVYFGWEKFLDVGFVGAFERVGGGETVGMEMKGSFFVCWMYGSDRRWWWFNVECGENLY